MGDATISMTKTFIYLEFLGKLSNLALLLMRVAVGAFLIWGVWDNIIDADRMREFEKFLAGHGFAWPTFMAPLSVYAQFICGLFFIGGFLTRWAGIICAFNFIVALIMVDAAGGIRSAFPAGILVLFGLFVATNGGGAISLDNRLFRQRLELTTAHN
jgi:putative oxidoreductase